MAERDSYVDFLRGLGLLLIVIAHTFAPDLLRSIRTFDVPLMVFISAVCYKPLRGGHLGQYLLKRAKRIYIPSAVFLVIFFVLMAGPYLVIGKPELNIQKIAGSFFLLNEPSIGYMWIMRVFLLMALLIPLLYNTVRRLPFIAIIFVMSLVLVLQQIMISGQRLVSSQSVLIVYNQFLLYLTGYSVFAVLGLKIRELARWQVLTVIILSGLVTAYAIYANNGIFNPEDYKYPPQILYIAYGIFGCMLLWFIKPYISSYTELRIFRYLSQNSMWLYLWHIIPVYFIPLLNFNNFWVGRYLIVVVAMIVMNIIWKRLTDYLPKRYREALQ